MHGTGKNAAKDYPEITCGAELRSHDGSEDGAGSGYVEELDHVNLPGGEGNVVHAVCFGYSRSLAGRVRAEDPVYQCSVKNISKHKGQDAEKKG